MRAMDSKGYAWFVATLLMFTYAIQHIDRQIIGVILEPVRAEFQLNDSQLGLLSGLAFAVAYSLAVIPFGIVIDRGNRRNILTFALATWSGLTALGSLATSYVQLLAVRMLVGAAEAGGNPSAISILSDYFDRKRRSGAVGLYFFGQGLGILAGFALGGYVVSEYGWRNTLLIAGLPGVVFAAVIFIFVREPRRTVAEPERSFASAVRGLRDSFFLCWRRRSLFWLICATQFGSAMVAAILIWMVSFLVRTHGVDIRSAGLAVGVGMGMAGAFGAISGGLIADWCGKQRPRNIPFLLATTQILGVVAFAFAFTADNYLAAVFFGALGLMLCHMRDGPAYALCASLAGANMRGQVMAFVLLLNNLVGYGLGPKIAGDISDFYAARAGTDSLQYALLTIVALGALGVIPFLVATRDLERELAEAEDAD